MPWANEVIIASQVIIQGPGDALYIYNGTAGPNKLLVSEVASATTDPYGNQVPAGVTWYSAVNPGSAENLTYGGQFTCLVNAAGLSSQAGAWNNDGYFFNDINGLFVQAPGGGALTLTDGAGTTTNQPFIANSSGAMQVSAAPGSSINLSSPVTATAGTASSQTRITTDSWHTMTLLNGWGNAAGVTARYRLMPDATVAMEGILRQGVAPTSTTIAALASPYLPNQETGFACGANAGVNAGTSPLIQIDTAGNVTIQNVTLGNPIVWYRGSFSII